MSDTAGIRTGMRFSKKPYKLAYYGLSVFHMRYFSVIVFFRGWVSCHELQIEVDISYPPARLE